MPCMGASLGCPSWPLWFVGLLNLPGRQACPEVQGSAHGASWWPLVGCPGEQPLRLLRAACCRVAGHRQALHACMVVWLIWMAFAQWCALRGRYGGCAQRPATLSDVVYAIGDQRPQARVGRCFSGWHVASYSFSGLKFWASGARSRSWQRAVWLAAGIGSCQYSLLPAGFVMALFGRGACGPVGGCGVPQQHVHMRGVVNCK